MTTQVAAPPTGATTLPKRLTTASTVFRRQTSERVSDVRLRVNRARNWLRATGRHGAWIAIWSVVGWTGTLAAPVLVENHPLLLMMLTPRALFVALAVDSVSLITFVALGTLRLSATDASYFILGRRFPRTTPVRRRRANGWFGRTRSLAVSWADTCCRWLCSHGIKAGTVLFFRPNGKYLAVAGAYGVSPRVAAATSVVGTMLYLAFFHLGMGLLT